MSGAVKFDQDKIPIIRGVFMRFPRALAAIAKVSLTGCQKYGVPVDDTSFVNVPDGFGRYTDALGRHLHAEITKGPINTEKGGLLPPEGVEILHAAQVAWNALARLEIWLAEQEKSNGKENAARGS